ncbi:hypothetical protein ACFRJ8_16445 [Arthrobacter sp. NPDC056886]|uniref:hypothetical protein n=1 Tax=Arthrobacter sp. NPDC056886 TaxID=3345960 RepID=UPI00366D4D34
MTLQNNRPSGRATDWDVVEIGDAVHLRRGGRLEHAGRVDNRTADGAVVWVVSEGGFRKLFHVTDGFELIVADPEGAGHADN